MGEKISGLPLASSVAADDLVPIVEAGSSSTKRVTAGQIAALAPGATPGGSNGDLQLNASGSLAPVRTSADGAPSAGDIARHDGTKWVAADDVAELPPGLTAGDVLFWTGSAIGRLPIGTDGQVLTVVGGLPAWADGGGGAPATFDLTTLPWSILLLPDYAGSPWVSTASAGTSGSRTFAGVTPPSAAPAVNGHVGARCNGTSQSLKSTDDADVLMSTAAYTIAMLVNLGTPSPSDPDDVNLGPYDYDQLIASPGYGKFGIAYTSSGVRAWHADTGGTFYKTDWKTCPSGQFAMVAVTYNGTTLSIDVNQSGAPKTIPAGHVHLTTSPTIQMLLGLNYFTNFLGMDVMAVCVAPTALSGADLDNVKIAFEDIIGSSL